MKLLRCMCCFFRGHLYKIIMIEDFNDSSIVTTRCKRCGKEIQIGWK